MSKSTNATRDPLQDMYSHAAATSPTSRTPILGDIPSTDGKLLSNRKKEREKKLGRAIRPPDTRRDTMPHDKQVALALKDQSEKQARQQKKDAAKQRRWASKLPTTAFDSLRWSAIDLILESLWKADRIVAKLVPAFPGATAEDSCVAGEALCDAGDANTASSDVTLGDLLGHASALDFQVELLGEAHRDRTVAGSIFVIADSHTNSQLQRKIAEFITKNIRPERGDKVLVERSPVDFDPQACFGQGHTSGPDGSKVCIPIDDAKFKTRFLELNDAVRVPLQNLLVGMIKSGSEPASKASKKAVTEDEILAIYRAASKSVQEATKKFYQKLEEARSARVDYMYASNVDRERKFNKMIKKHAGAKHATFVILGWAHVLEMTEQLRKRKSVVTLMLAETRASAEQGLKLSKAVKR